MVKFGILASLLAIATSLVIATTAASADDVKACVHKEFKTEMVKAACEKGGQPAAKKAMQDWVKTVKIDSKVPTCSTAFCHKNLAPNYDLKDNAVDQFKKAGGKMLDAK